MTDLVEQEREYRRNLWTSLLHNGGSRGVTPSILRELRIYGGAQGIWVDKTRTSHLTAEGIGVTVSVLHTGTAYADDLSADGLLYHYPRTNRPRTRDLAEIEATKIAGRLTLPIFVITYPSPHSMKRDVYVGWIEGWDDTSQLFLIIFDDTPPSQLLTDVSDQEPFALVEITNTTKREVAIRPGQQHFKFLVFQRYGLQCAVCSIDVTEVLDAAHIRPKNAHGSDDPRNGIVLCAVHHRALDAGLLPLNQTRWRFGTRHLGQMPKSYALLLQP